MHLDHMIDKAIASLDIPENPAELYNPVRYTLGLGGKRLRPKLALLAAGMCGGNPEKVLPAALSIELLHNFTLIHDDIMDHAATRRGQPSVHEKWDKETAILSGDVMFILAMKQLVAGENMYSDREKADLLHLFLDAIQTVCDGQAMDMAFEKRNDVTASEYLQMIHDKTAALFRCSMELGALLAGSDNREQQYCADIGKEAGMAFQIQDDLLDAVGDNSKIGKKVGGDINEGKKTYLSILAMERADDSDRLLLNQTLGKKDAGEAEILWVIRLYHDLGVIKDALAAITQHYNKAVQILALFDDSEYKRKIKTLFDQLKVRES